jgi:hypothetical protein
VVLGRNDLAVFPNSEQQRQEEHCCVGKQHGLGVGTQAQGWDAMGTERSESDEMPQAANEAHA